MALYRFLFAPALLAVAVLAGPGGEREHPVVEADSPPVVAPARVANAPPATPAPLERAVAAKHVAKRAVSAKR